MKVKVLTMTGGEYAFDNAQNAIYIEHGSILRVNWVSRNRYKNKDFPVVNVESIEMDESSSEK